MDNNLTINWQAATKQLLDKIITDQEGGWKLTSNANDPDGGWTFAGVTSTVWHEFEGTQYKPLTHANMVQMIDEPDSLEGLTDDIYRLYFEKFCTPLQLEKLPSILQGPVLSCAINRGVSEAVKILQTAVNDWFVHKPMIEVDGSIGSKTFAAIEQIFNDPSTLGHGFKDDFLREWTRSYIHLVVENAKAWQTWANCCYSCCKSGEVPAENDKYRPTIFRAGDLEGWFNRVEYWRGQ